MKSLLNKKTAYTFFSAGVIIVGALIAIQYAKGAFRVTDTGFQQETGLLAANSFPAGAQVYIDDKLVTATDDTLYLNPGEYAVKIVKDGYTPWNKTVNLEKELVVQTNAKLFPVAPSLTNLTFSGAQNLSTSPDGQKLIYYTASASASNKRGLYVMDLVDNPLPIQRGPRQISEDSSAFDLSTVQFIWSPDSTQAIVISTVSERMVLLDLSRINDIESLPDIGFQAEQILSEWEQEMYLREREFLAEFPIEVISMATQSAKNVYISPDKKRLLYTAIAEAAIPDTIVPPVPATNSQPEQRTLQPGSIYVYDREEDKNFKIGEETPLATDAARPTVKALLADDLYQADSPLATASASLFNRLQATESAQTARNFSAYHTPNDAQAFQWFPDSRHILFIENNSVRIKEYDGTNETILYSGPFSDNFLYPWPDGSRLLISTSFSPDTPSNLYAIELK